MTCCKTIYYKSRKTVTFRGLSEPASSELEILRILWSLGPSTVREVHEVLRVRSHLAYTTVLTTLQVMYQKGLVRRDESRRAHVYAPAINKRQTQGQLLGKLLQRVFEGSAAELVMQALGSGRPATADEIRMIRARLDSLERHKK